MENIKVWIRDNCDVNKLKHLDLEKLKASATNRNLGAQDGKNAVYALLVLAVIILLVRAAIARKNASGSILLRPRSPDPEKPTDVTTYAEKRMKPAERPPGGTSTLDSLLVVYADLNVCSVDTCGLQAPQGTSES